MSKVTFEDISLKKYGLTKRVSNLRKIYFKSVPEICVERPRLITRFTLENRFFDKNGISVLDKARTYRYVLEHRRPIVHHNSAYDKEMKLFKFQEVSLFAGSTTSKFKGVPLYPELSALVLWPELWSITKRASNPFHITKSEVKELNYKIFPNWIETSIHELTRKKLSEDKKLDQMKLFERLVFFLVSKPNCISHTIPDFSRAVKEGLRKIIDEAETKGGETTDDAKKEFYTAISEVLRGIIQYSRNIATKAEKLSKKEKNPDLKRELLKIAEINRRVPEFSAGSFREALTTIWICWTAVHLENPNVGLSLGRLDQILYDFYKRDIDEGVIDINDAIELICCLWLKIGDHVPTIPEAGEQLFGGTGSNQAITIGGIDKKGDDAVNDLTYVMLRATELMKLRDPNLNARYYSGINPPTYLKRICEVNIKTGATPAIHNDKAVISTLTQRGETVEQARDYGVIGCVEPGSNGRFYGHTGAILLNLASILELTLFNGRHRHTGMDLKISKETGHPAGFTTFEQFKNAFKEQSKWMITQAAELNNAFGRIHQKFYPTPILSSLFEGPMEKGKDLIQGGAVINSSGAAIIGLADVADSLSAIQKYVFEDKSITFSDLIIAIENNFEGYEELHTRLMNPDKTPKYGNENNMADDNTSWLVKFLNEVFEQIENYREGFYRVGFWTMTNHAGFGRLLKAMPNGRKDRENFASGITPVSGVTPYLTKTLNSVAKLPNGCLSNGVALNLKYTPEVKNWEKMLDKFAKSVEGYFDDENGGGEGGMEIQFNITSRETFEDARVHPENHLELLVRVSGYTAYFIDLNPQMQQEIIERTEYLLSTGEMVKYSV